MIKGRPGFFYNSCNQNNCWAKGAMAYPAGLINEKGGWITQNYHGNACIHEYMYISRHWVSGPHLGVAEAAPPLSVF